MKLSFILWSLACAQHHKGSRVARTSLVYSIFQRSCAQANVKRKRTKSYGVGASQVKFATTEIWITFYIYHQNEGFLGSVCGLVSYLTLTNIWLHPPGRGIPCSVLVTAFHTSCPAPPSRASRSLSLSLEE